MSDVYVVVHIATTCDEANGYVTKDSTETIELAWSVVDAVSLEVVCSQTVLVRPVNTPITPYCIQLHKISWEHVKSAGTFKDAIAQLDKSIQDNIISANKDFTFVSIDISNLRMHLPREARDKGVVLPPYLQHPRVFDLQVEYAKWQSTHPEALSYTSSSLSNIITALEVEVEEGEYSPVSSSSSTPPPPASGELSNTTTSTSVESSDDTHAKNAVSLYSKLLVQLVKKSLPLDDHLTVLTKPYDSSEDVKSFLGERSKILYLSNLPYDTTQSELESWFTQYGARPIGFWTLKNGDNKGKGKGISGFSVFSTHEEAVEALSLNGKALNDRAIEVQPSSTRVLDRASDLLTPFPPSKNRPRPGDWTCPSCGFSNFQRRTACFRCSFPAASAVTIQESIHPINGRRSNQTGTSPNSSTEKLQLNAAVINALNTSNQHYNNAAQYVSYNHEMNHGHPHNHNHNQNRNHYGNSVPFRAGDWKCTNESCQYHNFAKNLCCLKCGMNKPLNLNGQMNQKNHLNVNTTAAAIAAATASGQSLNLNNSMMLQSPQPHHSQQPQLQRQSYMKMQMQYPNSSNSSRSNSNGTPQLGPQGQISQSMNGQLSQSVNGQLSQSVNGQLSTQSMNQGQMSQHSLNQQALNQHSMSQHSLGQQPLSQPLSQQSLTQQPLSGQLNQSQLNQPLNYMMNSQNNMRQYSPSTSSPGSYPFGLPLKQDNQNFNSLASQLNSLNLNNH